jgi:hypothetical protein
VFARLVAFVVAVLVLTDRAAWAEVTPAAPSQSTRELIRARLPVVAVATLESRGVGVNEAGVIADNLAAKLQQSGKFRVMERAQMEQILKEQSFQQSGTCDQGDCAMQMAKILGLDRIIIGSVGLVGSTFSFNLRLVDVATGEALRTSARNKKGSIDDVLTDLVPQAVLDLTETPSSTGSAAPYATTASVPEEESKHRVWPWVLGGTVVVAGGAAAAFLLLDSESSSPAAESPTPSSSDNHLKFTW